MGWSHGEEMWWKGGSWSEDGDSASAPSVEARLSLLRTREARAEDGSRGAPPAIEAVGRLRSEKNTDGRVSRAQACQTEGNWSIRAYGGAAPVGKAPGRALRNQADVRSEAWKLGEI